MVLKRYFQTENSWKPLRIECTLIIIPLTERKLSSGLLACAKYQSFLPLQIHDELNKGNIVITRKILTGIKENNKLFNTFGHGLNCHLQCKH